MSDFQRPNIQYKPLEIDTVEIPVDTPVSSTLTGTDEDTVIANKLMEHLAQVKAYRDRVDSIDYLIDNAKKFAGNLSYSTDDTSLISSIQALGGSGNHVDLAMFEKAVDVVIQGYQEMALISLTGAAK